MKRTTTIDYGPLTPLIGIWQGDKGIDIAPEPDGKENNQYYETIIFTASGTVTNAEKQTLSILHYHQIVKRKSDDEVFHNQTGYWTWESVSNKIIHSLTIPRGVCVLAEGKLLGNTIEVSASIENKSIIQTSFMTNNAQTTSFKQTISLKNKTMKYAQVIMLEIYGKTFEHTDQNELHLQ